MCFAGINSNVDALIDFGIHYKLTHACVMRVRDPVDYSRFMLEVLYSVHVCYRSLDGGASV
ncbi:hypothetical protein VCR15J2_470530 [Vibrio coralliirubri]|nr:hypothetical protein VCR15J2_470530 [Vibrio coralliirubri]